jgi:hypothetical protein
VRAFVLGVLFLDPRSWSLVLGVLLLGVLFLSNKFLFLNPYSWILVSGILIFNVQGLSIVFTGSTRGMLWILKVLEVLGALGGLNGFGSCRLLYSF